ncbi:hypothetical protein B0J17DRAFT_648734 [Rhizoctonia solani]|nr:hypothetical protein B0J17DRAFT_648734 [Rhizoctonia solani]
MDRNPILNQTPEQETVQPQVDKTPKRPPRALQLSYIPPNSHIAAQPTMSRSPTQARRRATLTPYQTWHHATGSFSPPEPRVNEEWIYCGEETIPEVNSSNSSTSSKEISLPNPSETSASAPLYTSSTTPYTTPSPGCRSRSGSQIGVHYSTAHRRVPSSPSFRSTLTLAPHSYFDRPPSPCSSISSRSSEPPVSASLSLSELLTSTAAISLGEPLEDVDGFTRREMQRVERKQAMKERHVAIRERRERDRWAKAQTRC